MKIGEAINKGAGGGDAASGAAGGKEAGPSTYDADVKGGDAKGEKN